MTSRLFIKGCPLSSTPIQSVEDSGYFGSGPRRNSCISKSKTHNACSPIKEFSLKNVLSKNSYREQDSLLSPKNEDENIINYDISSKYELSSDAELKADIYSPNTKEEHILSNYTNASELYFRNSYSVTPAYSKSICSLESLSSNNDIKYELFPCYQSEDLNVSSVNNFEKSNSLISLPPSPETNLNLRKFNVQKVKIDFIHELKQMNCAFIVSNILSCLSPEELCKASCVSKEWKEAVSEDKKANFKKNKFISERTVFLTGPSKENRLGMRCGSEREHKNAFSNITNTSCITPHHSKSTKSPKTRFDSFIDEAEKGHVKLLKCPICFYASKVQNGSNYICTQCFHKFCSDCYSPVNENHTCHTPQLPNAIIGSKRSKKNLKRL